MEPPSTVWPFLYTRNTRVDYSFVLLPEVLSKDREGMEALERCLEKDASAGSASLVLPSRSFHVCFTSAPALLDGHPVLDHVGREIRAFVGILSTTRLSPRDADDLLQEARASVLGLGRLVWEGAKKEAVLSWGRAAAIAAPRVPAIVTPARHVPAQKTRWPMVVGATAGALCALGFGAGALAWKLREGRWADQLHEMQREKARADFPPSSGACGHLVGSGTAKSDPGGVVTNPPELAASQAGAAIAAADNRVAKSK